jgi:hypothetical protein
VSVGALVGYVDNDMFGTSSLVGGRVGVSVPFSPSSAMWLRGGAIYTHTKISTLGSVTITNIVPGGEVLFVFRPVENFGIMLGPMFEIGVNGKEKFEASFFGPSASQEQKFTYYEAGLTFGVLADF